jgi:hypothetical protein
VFYRILLETWRGEAERRRGANWRHREKGGANEHQRKRGEPIAVPLGARSRSELPAEKGRFITVVTGINIPILLVDEVDHHIFNFF